MNAITKRTKILIAIIVLFVAGLFGTVEIGKVIVQSEDQRLSAVDNCLRASVVTTTEADIVRTEPVVYIYELCMKDKGLSVSTIN